MLKNALCLFFIIVVCSTYLRAEVTVSSVFTDHMVLQRHLENKIWGWAAPEEQVDVSIGGDDYMATANSEGYWSVKLKAMDVGAPLELVIKGSSNTIRIKDILVGEVWLCSGQSNMRWPVGMSFYSNHEKFAANHPDIRFIKSPTIATEIPNNDFKKPWKIVSPETVSELTAVGYFFGRQLHHTLQVPIGLVEVAYGASAAEAWIGRSTLENAGLYDELLEDWDHGVATQDFAAEMDTYRNQTIPEWEKSFKAAKAQGKPLPRQPRAPIIKATSQRRPANCYNGMLLPVIGYGIKGAIWYQGESNASRAYQYRDLFPLLIETWRKEWGIGDFPFYWVQLADYKPEVKQPQGSAWAELREAQTMALDALKNTGQAVTIDLGEGIDIHPKNKLEVGLRLSGIALNEQYGFSFPYKSPRFKEMSAQGNRLVLSFKDFGERLNLLDDRNVLGFTIAGENKKFMNANARILIDQNTIEVWNDDIEKPVAVRYAWANNPICNVYSETWLPLTPFRTDDWPGLTINVVK